ncbi:uncharacterized protein RHO17_010807 isoform 1-T1 [Thomomys bottae]
MDLPASWNRRIQQFSTHKEWLNKVSALRKPIGGQRERAIPNQQKPLQLMQEKNVSMAFDMFTCDQVVQLPNVRCERGMTDAGIWGHHSKLENKTFKKTKQLRDEEKLSAENIS